MEQEIEISVSGPIERADEIQDPYSQPDHVLVLYPKSCFSGGGGGGWKKWFSSVNY